MPHRQGDRADANTCPINVGERLRTIAAVPLIKNRDIQRKLPAAPNYESGVRSSNLPGRASHFNDLVVPALPRRRIRSSLGPWADFGRANSLHLGSATPFAANPTAREMTRGTGRSAPARDRSWNGACCPIGPYRHPGVADQNLGLRARTSFWSPLQDSHSSQRHRRPAGPSGEGSQADRRRRPPWTALRRVSVAAPPASGQNNDATLSRPMT